MENFTFGQWLLINEAMSAQRAANMSQDINSRVKFGKGAEAKILNALREQHGWVIAGATNEQDMYGKIDGIVRKADQQIPIELPAPIQVKYRDSGDDILLEVVWKLTDPNAPVESLLTGRDMVGKSTLYACANQAGTLIRVRSAQEAKQIARGLLEKLLASKRSVYTDGSNQIRIVNDPRDQRTKVNAFINPNSFSWKADYPVESIWAEPEPEQSPKMTIQEPALQLPQGITPSMAQAVAAAVQMGQAIMPAPNNMKKIKTLEQFAKRKGVSLQLQGDKILFKKVA